ncbi:hypothetical protein [Spirosoma pomorum]|jgi:hypothetical protein
MKAITFTIDLKSFFLGALAVSAVLLMANKPDRESAQQNQSGWPNQRYQAITGKDTRTIIMDTQTGRFLVERPTMGLPAWAPMDFEESYRRK